MFGVVFRGFYLNTKEWKIRADVDTFLTLFRVARDGRNRAIVIAESLARVIAAIRITSVCLRSYLPLKHGN